MTSLQLAAANLLSPMTLCFAFGALAAWIRSDFRLPEPVFATLAIYLMLSIGLKGGAELATVRPSAIVLPIVAALSLCIVVPLWCYAALRRLVGLDRRGLRRRPRRLIRILAAGGEPQRASSARSHAENGQRRDQRSREPSGSAHQRGRSR